LIATATEFPDVIFAGRDAEHVFTHEQLRDPLCTFWAQAGVVSTSSNNVTDAARIVRVEVVIALIVRTAVLSHIFGPRLN
jgi:hypothetical protein